MAMTTMVMMVRMVDSVVDLVNATQTIQTTTAQILHLTVVLMIMAMIWVGIPVKDVQIAKLVTT